MSQDRWVERLCAELRRQGWTFRRGSKHMVVYPKNREKRPIAISMTPGDRFAQSQALRELRKAGATV